MRKGKRGSRHESRAWPLYYELWAMIFLEMKSKHFESFLRRPLWQTSERKVCLVDAKKTFLIDCKLAEKSLHVTKTIQIYRKPERFLSDKRFHLEQFFTWGCSRNPWLFNRTFTKVLDIHVVIGLPFLVHALYLSLEICASHMFLWECWGSECETILFSHDSNSA